MSFRGLDREESDVAPISAQVADVARSASRCRGSFPEEIDKLPTNCMLRRASVIVSTRSLAWGSRQRAGQPEPENRGMRIETADQHRRFGLVPTTTHRPAGGHDLVVCDSVPTSVSGNATVLPSPFQQNDGAPGKFGFNWGHAGVGRPHLTLGCAGPHREGILRGCVKFGPAFKANASVVTKFDLHECRDELTGGNYFTRSGWPAENTRVALAAGRDAARP